MAGNKTERAELEISHPRKRRIIGQIQASKTDGQGIAIIEFEPIIAGDGIGHPFIDAEVGRIAKSSGAGIGCAGRGRSQQIPRPGTPANRAVGNLEAESDGIDDLGIGIE